MAKLTVSGKVIYNDATPAGGVTVAIRDLDGLDGREDDCILRTVTDAAGRFAGSGDWKDREARVLGFEVPDILRLVYTANQDGQTYQGPFLRIDDALSAPIVLPRGPRKPVDKSKRALVQIILVSNGYAGAERALYEFVEVATEKLTRSILAGSYRTVTFVKGENATLRGLVDALVMAARPTSVEAVDLIFSTHGSTSAVTFAEGLVSEDDLRRALLAMPAEVRTKLRICFSTACYGATHVDTWRAGGFSDASGAKGIYADSAVSYAPFLTAWAAELTFAEAVAAANAADIGDIADKAARRFYDIQGRPAAAAAIDSTRAREGEGFTRIYSMPGHGPMRAGTLSRSGAR